MRPPAGSRLSRRLFAWGTTDFEIGRQGTSHRVRGLWVSGSLFPTLQLRAWRGRLVDEHDDVRGCGAGPVVVSHAYWERELTVPGRRATRWPSRTIERPIAASSPPSDPVTIAMGLAVLAAIGLAAAWVPAARASGTSVLDGLRAD